MSEDQIKFFKALGDETRLLILGFLLKNEHCACDFTKMSDRDQTTISRHLKVLTDAGIVKNSKRGRNLVYSIRDDEMRRQLMSVGIEPQDTCCDMGIKDDRIRGIVKNRYSKIALEGGSCGCGSGCCGDEGQNPITISASLGYSQEDLGAVPASNLGLGCGNPVALGQIREGDTVLDLGSGAGMDAFLAAQKVGKRGKVIGVDITEEMVEKARKNAKDNGFKNVEFKLGDIEELPLENGSVDVVLSNCVINLAPNKSKVFGEAFRVLRSGGKLYISDMVLLEDLTEEQREDEELISGCVAGAVLKEHYLQLVWDAGFHIDEVIEDKGISKRQYQDLPVESVKIVARKPET